MKTHIKLSPDQFHFYFEELDDLLHLCGGHLASDTLTAVCPKVPLSLPLLLGSVAGEYYWMSI